MTAMQVVKADGQLGRPVINMTTNLADVVDETVGALARDPDVYHRDARLVHVVRAEVDSDGPAPFLAETPQIRAMAAATLRERLTRVARFRRFDRRSDDWVDALPSDPVVHAVLARGEYPGVRPLVGIVESPSIRPDGTIIQVPGYDRASGWLYAPSADFPPVPERPTQADAARALAALEEVFADFPFAGPDHRATTIANVLTLVGRPAIRGRTPATIHESNVRGAGKTLKADAVSTIATGRPTAKMAYPPDDIELEKVLAAYALRGATSIAFDNVVRPFGGGPLDRCLTAGDTVELRPLGKSEIPALRWRAVIMATGTNIALTGDTSRRSIMSRIESPLEHPEDRQDFAHPRLLEWLQVERPRLILAALVVLRAWYVAGCPRGACKTWGSFEAWSSIVPPAIVFAGGADPMQTRPAVTGEEDAEKSALVALIEGLARLDPSGAGVTARAIIDSLYPTERLRGQLAPDGFDALREAIDGLTSNPPGRAPSAHKLGNKLRKLRRRVVGARCLDCTLDDHTKVARWRVSSGTAGTAGSVPSARVGTVSDSTGGMDGNRARSARSSPDSDAPTFAEDLADLGVGGEP